MVKAYLRYEPAAAIGVISSSATILYGSEGTVVITAALEAVKIWNIRSGELVCTSSRRTARSEHFYRFLLTLSIKCIISSV